MSANDLSRHFWREKSIYVFKLVAPAGEARLNCVESFHPRLVVPENPVVSENCGMHATKLLLDTQQSSTNTDRTSA